ncbi:MAG: trehalose-6-phosphate synthase [Acidobacteriota bacterium]|nr:MAG: trehalose-6-phosphate synthase [Acidobacteriota bacterium]
MSLIVVSNRLPISLERQSERRWQLEPGSGGLVTAMAPVLRDRGGRWVGWAGIADASGSSLDQALEQASRGTGYRLEPVQLDGDDVRDYYEGFSNEVVWPLFHDQAGRCRFMPEYWYRYLEVNRKFARAIARNSSEDDYIWVHDYHLMHVGQSLRQQGGQRRLGFFMHIPFPPVDLFVKLPWREKILEALLEYDLIGLQTMRDRRNFLECLERLDRRLKPSGRGPVVTLKVGQRNVRVGSFPISIDFKDFVKTARTREVQASAARIRSALAGQEIMLSVDRLDYSKGIPERLEGLRAALRKYPDLSGKLTLIQIVVPSRERVEQYQLLKAQVEQLVGEINGEFTRPGWVPVQHIYRSFSRADLVAYYAAADIGLITPLKDGMNLVSKEYCACRTNDDGVLILSEFAGSASQLHRGALLINAHDREGTASAIYDAFGMSPDERHARMRRLRTNIRNQDIFWWVDTFLQTAFGRQLGDLPTLEEYPRLASSFGAEPGSPALRHGRIH